MLNFKGATPSCFRHCCRHTVVPCTYFCTSSLHKTCRTDVQFNSVNSRWVKCISQVLYLSFAGLCKAITFCSSGVDFLKCLPHHTHHTPCWCTKFSFTWCRYVCQTDSNKFYVNSFLQDDIETKSLKSPLVSCLLHVDIILVHSWNGLVPSWVSVK